MTSIHSPSSCARCGSRKKLNPNAPDRDGKAISARNATSHGLFARDVVLPHLGEDAAAYKTLLNELLFQIAPKNLLEEHYVEKIAAGTWRLRRLHRWQAQLFEDPSLDEGERLDKLEKVLRHETTLHRQIDAAVKMLGKDVAQLFASRARAQALAEWHTSEAECRATPAVAQQVEHQTRHNLAFRPFPTPDFDLTSLDTDVKLPASSAETDNSKICQNETAPAPTAESEPPPPPAPPAAETPSSPPLLGADGQDNEICQNEPPVPSPVPVDLDHPLPAAPLLFRGGERSLSDGGGTPPSSHDDDFDRR